MTLAQENHLSELIREIRSKLAHKYRAGQAEHGGDLWERVPLIDDVIDEATDQMTYALTLKWQLERVKKLIEDARDAAPDNPVTTQKLLTRAMSYL